MLPATQNYDDHHMLAIIEKERSAKKELYDFAHKHFEGAKRRDFFAMMDMAKNAIDTAKHVGKSLAPENLKNVVRQARQFNDAYSENNEPSLETKLEVLIDDLDSMNPENMKHWTRSNFKHAYDISRSMMDIVLESDEFKEGACFWENDNIYCLSAYCDFSPVMGILDVEMETMMGIVENWTNRTICESFADEAVLFQQIPYMCDVDKLAKDIMNGYGLPLDNEIQVVPDFVYRYMNELINSGVKSHLKLAQPKCGPFYAEWSEWSSCSSTCGNGIKHRTQVCDKNTEFLENACMLHGDRYSAFKNFGLTT